MPSASAAASQAGPLLPAIACFLLVLGVVLIFAQTARHDWINFDDDVYSYSNRAVRAGLTWANVGWAFCHFHAANYHPLTWLSHMLDWQLYDGWPGGHHLTNVLLHAANACLLLLVLRRLSGRLWRSAFVAAVFAFHPLRVESVAWVAERKDLLSGLFFMLTLWAYIDYARRPFQIARYLSVAAFFAIGLLCKPMLVTVPFVLLLLDYWPLRRETSPSSLIKEKLPLLAMTLISALVTVLAQQESIQSLEAVPVPSRIANAIVSYVIYLARFALPVDLASYYPNVPRTLLAPSVIGSLLLLIVVTAFAWKLRRRVPGLLVGWLWYLGMMLPVIGLIQVGGQASADRYTYLPLIGPCLLVFELPRGKALRSQRPAMALAATCILSVLMAASWRQTTYWRDSQTLWTRTLRATNDNWLAHGNLGAALVDLGQLDAAAHEYHEAIRLRRLHKLKTPDAIIAATALLQQAEVITRNTTDFKKVAGLSVLDTQSF